MRASGGHTLVKGSYSYQGQLGLAPEWKSGACGTTCQENISACLMAHVNTSGAHYPLWVIGPQASLGWGRSNARPFIEAAFFGNLFSSPPKAYYCNGPDYERVPVKGRIGAETSSTVFRNPYSGDGMCNDNCQSNSDGYTSCSSYTRPITVYRDLDTANAVHASARANRPAARPASRPRPARATSRSRARAARPPCRGGSSSATAPRRERATTGSRTSAPAST